MLHISFIKIFHIPSNLLPLICLFSSSKESSEILFSLLSFFVVRLGGFELPTHGLGNRCSIHLSYRRIRTLLF